MNANPESTSLTLLLGFIGGLIVAILANLISNQIEAWLPLLARRIVRLLANWMGERAERCREEWPAHLDQTVGGLAQLGVALGMVRVPVRMVIDKHRDELGGLFGSIGTSILRRTSWVFVPILVLFFVNYPLQPGRYATYAFVLPLLVVGALISAPQFWRATSARYERLGYTRRVFSGGVAFPVLVYFVVVWTLIGPSWQSPRKVNRDTRASARPSITFVQILPKDALPRKTETGNATPTTPRLNPPETDVVLVRELEPTEDRVLAQEPVPTDGGPDHGSTPPIEGAAVLSLTEVEQVLLPEQPIPSLQDPPPPVSLGALPSAPMNLRIVP
jgi:hypothetical protein